MDAEVARLVREQRLLEAAELASTRGDAEGASEIFERACAWQRAAEEALRAGDAGRALSLAIEARDDALASRAVPLIAGSAKLVERIASQLERRGDNGWAARVYEAAGRLADAARASERAGDAGRAAELFERVREPAEAARALEAAIRRDGERWDLHVLLGTLLARYGKAEAAVRALQRVPETAPERRSALGPLGDALRRLGLDQAAAANDRELAALGGALESDAEGAVGKPPLSSSVRMRLFGRYEIVREVASTPTARVLECIDVVRGERVAVKIFAAYDVRGAGRDALARFEREVKVLGSLDHPNVVALCDYFADGPAIVMAWMSGGTLEAMLAEGAIAPARAIEIASAVLSALGEAHRLGVLHRDIKPANVLFDEAGVARLADFGVAHLGDLSTTATAGVIGTLAYMSPEQREGRPATIQSDLYGVGAILREMLTGEHPVPTEPPRTRPSAMHRDLDARHDEVVLGFTQEDPALRPSDAFAARRALLALRWPPAIEPAAPRPIPERIASVRPAAARLEIALDGSAHDRWIDRAIDRVPLTERALARASVFAQARSTLLQMVLRIDRAASEIWLDRARGLPLARALTPDEARALHAAIDALHDTGIAHGCICPAHVYLDTTGELTLRFHAEAEATATIDLDRIALAELAHRA